MIFLLLCILSSTGIFVSFKLIDQHSIPVLPVIVINYFLATILGFYLHGEIPSPGIILSKDWLIMGVVIGIMFIIMFFLVALSSKKAGLSVTTVASKMSVVVPIIFSMIIESGDRLTFVKSVAIICALAGVILTVYRPVPGRTQRNIILIPLLLFTGMGVVDSLVKFAQHQYVNDAETALFSAVLFLNAFTAGIISLFLTRTSPRAFTRVKTWISGLSLGAVNFGSIYFMVRALNHINTGGVRMDSSVIFGVNNTGIVVLSVLLGFLVFREKILLMNWMGVAISVLALILFTLGG